MFKACIGFRSRRVEYLDKTHCSLARIPEEVYRNERWLEELIMDMNMIQEFPPVRLLNIIDRALALDTPRCCYLPINTIAVACLIVEILSAGESEAAQCERE